MDHQFIRAGELCGDPGAQVLPAGRLVRRQALRQGDGDVVSVVRLVVRLLVRLVVRQLCPDLQERGRQSKSGRSRSSL